MTNRILIITGESGDAEILNRALSSATDGPYSTECATRLADGLARLEAGGIDAILVDLSLADSQGIETFDKLYAAAPHTPILTLCASEDEAPAREAVARGAQGYLLKGHFGSYLVPHSLRNTIQRKAVEEALFVEKTRAEVTLNSISDAVIGTDLAGNVDYLNAAAESMTGWTRDEARLHPIDDVMRLVNRTTRDVEANPTASALRENKPAQLAPGTILIRRDGREIAISDSSAPIHDRDGRLSGAVIVFHDVTVAQAMALQMAHLSQYDALTELPNRVLLNDRIAIAIAQATRRETFLAVLFLDLDYFKLINDSLGHEIGDKLLQSIAERLLACVRSSDTVSRLGGDEFVILVSDEKSLENAAVTAEKILAEMAKSVTIDNKVLNVTTSIGISMYPADGRDGESLIRNADVAMYQAKKNGRNNYAFFNQEMNVRAIERQSIEADLRHALANNELVLYYQPKINLDTGKITGAEALLRWMHPKWGVMMPARFVPVAEESGLIVPIGRWVLQEACVQAKRWQEAGLKPARVAVNVSALEFRQKGFVTGVRDVLIETGLDAGCLQLELTESVLMRDVGASIAALFELKAIGVELAVDDFGTGYSSLSYLKKFPIDTLKIDQSFVRNIEANRGDSIIVSAIVAMGRSFRQNVIAEGVEKPAQIEMLMALQCDEGQGYIFSRPLTAKKFAELLAKGICETVGHG